MIFYNFPKEGAMKYRLQKKKKKRENGTPPLSGWAQPPFSVAFYTYTHWEAIYTHTPPRFHKK